MTYLYDDSGGLRWANSVTHWCMTARAWQEATRDEEHVKALLQPEDLDTVTNSEVTEVKAGVDIAHSGSSIFAGFSVRAKEQHESVSSFSRLAEILQRPKSEVVTLERDNISQGDSQRVEPEKQTSEPDGAESEEAALENLLNLPLSLPPLPPPPPPEGWGLKGGVQTQKSLGWTAWGPEGWGSRVVVVMGSESG